MRFSVLSGLLLLACARDPQPAPKSVEPEPSSPPPPATSATAPSSSSKRPLASCLAVAQEGPGDPAIVEGTIGSGKDGLFTLRLAKPRCVVGLPNASFIAEVAIVSTGFDLRPLVGARVRASGDAIAGQTDMGGPAVIVMVKEVDRLPPAEHAP